MLWELKKNINKNIIEQDVDYILTIKDNQKIMPQDIKTAFKVYKKEQVTVFETLELNGSRVEKRGCKTMIDTDYIEQADQWRNLKKFTEIKTEASHKRKNDNR
jgi:hypothetical protein